jgi:hypothetical protein
MKVERKMASTDATIAHKGRVELRDTWYEAEIEDYPEPNRRRCK